jgi:uncharacterized protein DUF87
MGRRRHRGDEFAGSAATGEYGYRVPNGHWASRLAPYAGEWAGGLGLFGVSEACHLWLGHSPALPGITPVISLLGAGLSALTWRAGSSRSGITRAHATITTAAATTGLVSTVIAGMPQPMVVAWVFGGGALCLSWNIRRALRNSGEEEGGGNLWEQVKLAKVRATAATTGPNKVTARLQLPAGGETSVEDVQKASDRIGQTFRLHKGAVRVVGDPDDLSQAEMTIVPIDVLRHPTPWPGPSSPGGSMVEGLVVGVYEDGEPQQLFLPADLSADRTISTHIGVQGMTGSGKTRGAKLAWTEILTRRDGNLIVCDPSKGEQSVKFLDGKAHLVIGAKQCKTFAKRLLEAITERTTQLGRWGYDQWTPEVFTQHGMPYLTVWIEEAPKVLQDAQTVTQIAQEARSAGISLILSLQKATYRQMPTDTRSQLGGTWCFGVKELEDAAYLLSEEAIDAGARPDRWKNRRPGCNYLEGIGIDEARAAVPGRTFDATDDELRAAITACDDIRPALWGPTATTLGLPERPASLGGAAGPQDTDDSEDDDSEDNVRLITTARPAGDAFDGDAFDDPDGDWDRMPLDADTDELAELPEDPEPGLEVEPDLDLDSLADDPDMPLPQPKPTRRQAVAMVRSAIQELAARGQATFTVRDLPDPKTTLGRERSWLSTELAGFARDGELEVAGQDGKATVYRIRARAHTRARDAA